MASPVLGIDLGTTNSVVAVASSERVDVLPDEQGRLLTPSVVSFHPSGEVLVGVAAVERKLVDAPNTVASIKRLIGRPFRSPEVRRAAERFAFELSESKSGGVVVRARGEEYSLPEISAFVLRRLKAVAEKALHTGCSSVVVTVPANFNELQRTATRDAARIAGLNVLRILNEPTAAALAYGYGARARKRIAVYDLGGGTFDVSILDLSGDVIEVVATAGDSYLGGDDVDNAIAEAMAARFLREHRIDLRGDGQAYERLRLAAEWLKCELSSKVSVEATLEELAFDGRGRPIHYTFDFTRDKLHQLAFPLIGRTFDICEEALQVAGLRPSQLDDVVLVGGQTRSPQVREMVAEYFGCQPQTTVDPDQVVAQGAALQAMALSGQAGRPFSRTLPGTASGPPRVAREPGQGDRGAPSSAAGESLTFDDEPTHVAQRPTAGEPMAAPAARRGDQRGPPGTDQVSRAAPAVIPPPPPAGAGHLDPEPGPSTVPRRGTLRGSDARRDDTEVMQLRRSSSPPGGRWGGSPSSPPAGAELLVDSGAQDLSELEAVSAGEPWLSPLPPAAPGEEDLPYALRSPEDEPRWQPDAVSSAIDDALGFDVPISSAPPAPPSSAPAPMPGPRAPTRPRDGGAEGAPASEPTAYERASEPTAEATPSHPSAHPYLPDRSAASGPAPSQVKAPLLLDVTPRALAIETAGGFCEQVVQRNSPIPTEQSRVFSTSQDRQVQVSMRVCQGEARRTDDNEVLGALELLGLREAPRGQVRIGVTFVIDADGMLRARAQDRTTGRSQEIRINLVGALDDDEIERMRRRQESMLGQG